MRINQRPFWNKVYNYSDILHPLIVHPPIAEESTDCPNPILHAVKLMASFVLESALFITSVTNNCLA